MQNKIQCENSEIRTKKLIVLIIIRRENKNKEN